MASRAAEQMHGVRHAGVPVDTYPLPVGFVLQAWRTPAVKGRLEVGQRALTSCDPPPQTNLPAAPGQRGAGHQQLHIREGLKFFFSNSHIVMAIHQSSPCEQWEPLEGAESVRRGNKKELVGERLLLTQEALRSSRRPESGPPGNSQLRLCPD